VPAHAYEDLTIELLNYDEEMIHSAADPGSVAEVVSNETSDDIAISS